MRTVNVTDLRSGLFGVLDEVGQGEIVVVERRGKVVAKIVPATATNWREGVTVRTRVPGPVDQAFAPMDDLWEQQT